MTQNRVTIAMEKYGKLISKDSRASLQSYLKEAPDECMDELMSLKLKSPVLSIFLSIFFGGIGVDRFYVGDTAIGVAKIVLRILGVALSTLEVPLIGSIATLAASIWCFVDIFLVFKSVRVYNYTRLISFLIDQSSSSRIFHRE